MIKYTSAEIVMQEIPNEVSLALNISNCQNNCVGCHSTFLQQDIGKILDVLNLDDDIKKYLPFVTNILFLGEGKDQQTLLESAVYFKNILKKKVSLYSGRIQVEDIIYNIFDYVKVGPYIEKFGPLNKNTTNQRLYKITGNKKEDITYMFWSTL